MSTKIHNGYRLAAGVDPFDLIDQLRATLDPIRDRLDAREFAALVTRDVDEAVRTGTIPDSWLTGVRQRDLDQRSQSPSAWGVDPHRFELAFGRDPRTGRVGVLRYCEDGELHEAFEAFEQVQPYSFWDNVEAPPGVSAEQWRERGDFWDRVTRADRGGGIPAEAMLTWKLRTRSELSFAPTLVDGFLDLVAEEVPATHARARQMAYRSVMAALEVARPAAKPSVPDLMRIARAVDARLDGPLGDIAEEMVWGVRVDEDLIRRRRELDLGRFAEHRRVSAELAARAAAEVLAELDEAPATQHV